MSYVLPKEKLGAWVAELAAKHEVVAPTLEDGVLAFKKVVDGENLDMSSIPNSPPKTEFLPSYETLFSYKKDGDEVRFETPKTKKSRIVFGAHSCDFAGLDNLDETLSECGRDVFLAEKRAETTIVGVSCQPDGYCWCTSVGLCPTHKQGADLFLTDIGDKYLVEELTPKGKKLRTKLLKKASKKDVQVAKKTAAGLKKAVSLTFDPEGADDDAHRVLRAADASVTRRLGFNSGWKHSDTST